MVGMWTLRWLSACPDDAAMHLVSAAAVLALHAVGTVCVPAVFVLGELGDGVVVLGSEVVSVEVRAGSARFI